MSDKQSTKGYYYYMINLFCRLGFRITDVTPKSSRLVHRETDFTFNIVMDGAFETLDLQVRRKPNMYITTFGLVKPKSILSREYLIKQLAKYV